MHATLRDREPPLRMSDEGRFVFAVVVATILLIGMVGLMGLLMVVNTRVLFT